MPIIAPYHDIDAEEIDATTYKRLTKQEAQALRKQQPALSPWHVVLMQVMAGLSVTMIAWAFSQKASVAWSAAYGSLAVIVPAALFARGLMRQFASGSVVEVGFRFFAWEAAKLAVSVAMLFAAPKLVTELSWLALLIGLIVTMKVYWVALLMRPKLKQSENI